MNLHQLLTFIADNAQTTQKHSDQIFYLILSMVILGMSFIILTFAIYDLNRKIKIQRIKTNLYNEIKSNFPEKESEEIEEMADYFFIAGRWKDKINKIKL